ncbi:MAG: hypothetical protein ACOCY0_05210, partial [Roseicyclus sp.]
DLALVDADELGFDATALARLLGHLAACGAAALVVTGARGLGGLDAAALVLRPRPGARVPVPEPAA